MRLFYDIFKAIDSDLLRAADEEGITLENFDLDHRPISTHRHSQMKSTAQNIDSRSRPRHEIPAETRQKALYTPVLRHNSSQSPQSKGQRLADRGTRGTGRMPRGTGDETEQV